MKHLNSYLETFASLLGELADSNLIIGGSFALFMHGLSIGKAPADLDLIIYNPSPHQKSVLHKLKQFDLIKFDKNEKHEYIKERMKFKRMGLEIDILIEREFIPTSNLLLYQFRNILYKIQSVKGVIDAKVSYIQKDEQKRSPNYARLKDVQDLINLKNLNFNL